MKNIMTISRKKAKGLSDEKAGSDSVKEKEKQKETRRRKDSDR